jgi:hydroxymethylpyrimidine/phosphomethylpyrimidine kinase
VATLDERRAAARDLLRLGPRAVVVKGGHAGDAVDVFYDGDQLLEFPGQWIDTRNTHGSGCAFSAAIAALLASGLAPLEAVRQAKAFIQAAIRAGHDLGSGPGPVDPLFGL